MQKAIKIPRLVTFEDVDTAYPFDSQKLDIFDIKQGRELIKLYKEYHKNAFYKGFTVPNLLMAETKSLDKFLATIWDKFLGSKYDYLTLAAVGGYGRQEQFVESDIDLLIISGVDPIPEDARATIENLVSFLWDLKLDLGTSVRTIKETVLASREDITIITNLLETHYIVGNKEVYDKLKLAIRNDEFWDDEKFFEAKVAEQNERYHSFRDTIYSLEPDVKNNPGGLRDLHIMQWLAIKIFNLGEKDDLCSIGLLTKDEYEEYLNCQAFLWDVRYAVHCNSNSNILRLDFQKSVASTLGYGDVGNEPVENMMRDLYRIFLRVTELNYILLQQVSLKVKGYVGKEFTEPVFINSNFVQRGSFIDVLDHELFKNDPSKMLDLFIAVANHPEIKHIHLNCLRALREGRRELNYDLISDEKCRKKFREILKKTDRAPIVFELMHATRVLSSYMPQWARIEGLSQFDRFHLFSVDEHTIRVIKNDHDLAQSKDPSYQLFKVVHKKLSDPELLVTASLLHDIAKGRGGSHAQKGSKEALEFCKLHGYNDYETSIISWLVASHLQFNSIATRRDITDLEEINKFADFVKDEEHLNLLYCLTVSDISATNDNVWNSWKDNLFRQLYQSTKVALNQEGTTDLDNSMNQQAQERKDKVVELTKECKKDDVLKYIRQFSREYFIHYQPEEIAWHARNILRFPHADKPLILFSQTPNVGTELLVYYPSNAPAFFGNLVRTMAMKQLNVFSAQVFLTHNFHALCTIMFQNKKGQPLDHDRLNSLRKAIISGLDDKSQTLDLPNVEHRIFDIPTIISYLDSDDNKHTKLEISTLDRQGLLAKIGITLGNQGCLISAARITTTGERADDYFAITDVNGLPLDLQKKEELSKALKVALDD